MKRPRDPERKARVHAALVRLFEQGGYITPKIVAEAAGYNAAAKISWPLKVFEDAGFIIRIQHSWHNVQIVRGHI